MMKIARMITMLAPVAMPAFVAVDNPVVEDVDVGVGVDVDVDVLVVDGNVSDEVIVEEDDDDDDDDDEEVV
jgi:hypothetical protein